MFSLFFLVLNMRIIEELSISGCRISIFQMNQKYLIKVEKGPYEQVYKIAELDLTDGLNDVKALLDQSFIQSCNTRFDAMHIDFRGSLSRINP